MIKTIISDLGNVVLNFNHMIACNNLARFTSFKPSEIYDYVCKSELDYLFDTGKITSEKFFEETLKHLKLKLDFENFKEIFADIFTVNTTMADILSRLKGKYKLILLSNTNKIHFDYVKSKFDVLNIFDKFVLSYKLGVRKPDPEIYKYTIKESNSEASECVYIDDIEEFVNSALNLGIIGIHYKSDNYLKNRLNQLNLSIY